jgi:hypothetical protein
MKVVVNNYMIPYYTVYNIQFITQFNYFATKNKLLLTYECNNIRIRQPRQLLEPTNL